MATGIPYKILVQPPVGFETHWHSGATSWSVATSTASPSTSNFSLEPTSLPTGIARLQGKNHAVDDTRLYAHSATRGAFVSRATSTAIAAGFRGATQVTSLSTNINQPMPP